MLQFLEKIARTALVAVASIGLFVLSCSRQKSAPKWQPQNSGVTASFRGLSAASSNVAWVTGTQGTVLRTIDGGESWQKSAVPGADSLDFRDVEAFDTKTALLMSAGTGEASRIYRTDDVGQSWQLLYTNTLAEGFFDGMAFWDREHGLLYGDPIDGKMFVMTTADGGFTWQRVPPDALPEMNAGEYGFAASGTGIAVSDTASVWIGTGGAAARVFYSHDRGQNWAVAETPLISGEASTGIFSIAFADAQNGIVVGGDYQQPNATTATVARSTDGGQSWQLVESGAPVSFRSAVAYLPGTGGPQLVAVGSHGASYSTDGGATWIDLGEAGYHALSIDPDGKSIWAAGGEGRIAKLTGFGRKVIDEVERKVNQMMDDGKGKDD